MTIADGWYKGKVSMGRGNDYGDNLALLLQLEVEYEDGKRDVITSDGNFVYTYEGPYRYGDLFTGEKYDARMELPGWSEVAFDDSRWQAVHRGDYPYDANRHAGNGNYV
ncbi:hypothetical protein P22_3167 [Propionispora sp. 2/2-37]|uniref:alpha-L-rhamnosidase N-terminal domain-containing protein n=1 Tax=Propionispora sp. 2/2-37 TaxID=1677858 RepID=UPI0006C61DC7|nr:alpha-L-rhamnosidase N-terminal domain-containing protein [Propionispora sp. 2/2-37]CUH97041.1 hypothetical protein P22_3167 [Propionispora sp. 2/2-37]